MAAQQAILTFKNLGDQVMNFLDQAGIVGTPRDVVDDTIRRVHNSRLIERKWNFMLWDAQQTLSTVAGQKVYSLHSEFLRPYWFFNRTTKRTMEQVYGSTLLPSDGVRDYDSGFGTGDWTAQTGEAYRFQLGGVTPVANQPSSASVLTITGTALKTVTVKGETTDGITTETITVGTPGTTQFTKILQVTKGEGFTGLMTMTSNGGAVTNLKLFAAEYGRQYRQLELLNAPVAVETLIYKFYRKPSYLDSDNSIPDIPAPFSEVLVYDALLQMGAYNQNLSASARGLWKEEQFRLEQGLLDYDDGPDSLGAAPTYQNWTPRD